MCHKKHFQLKYVMWKKKNDTFNISYINFKIKNKQQNKQIFKINKK